MPAPGGPDPRVDVRGPWAPNGRTDVRIDVPPRRLPLVRPMIMRFLDHPFSVRGRASYRESCLERLTLRQEHRAPTDSFVELDLRRVDAAALPAAGGR